MQSNSSEDEITQPILPVSPLEEVKQVKLTSEVLEKLNKPSKISEFQRQKLERFSKKNWDLFYKRNGNKFFKNRYWTRSEFHELFVKPENDDKNQVNLLEIGCGCGDFVLPLLDSKLEDGVVEREEKLANTNLYIYCCDISDRAIEILKQDAIYRMYNPHRIKAFVADITTSAPIESTILLSELDNNLMDIVSLIFVMSALDPNNMKQVVKNLSKILKPNGLVLFRDYAIYDEAMLRFSEDSKISNQFYVRQDGTRSYFFTKEQLLDLFLADDYFHCQSIDYIKRETINNSTKAKFSRIFLQAKFKRKENS